jgi:hypothetical protein
MHKVNPAVLAALMMAENGVRARFPIVPLSPELKQSYENADYVVFGEPKLVFRIGERSPDLDALMKSHGAATAAFVSAANPDGERQSDAENRVAHEELLESEWLAGRSKYEGEGRDPQDQWPAEPSVLVVGIEREDAIAIGLGHAQNAIVFIEKGRAPELVTLI